MPLIPEKTLLGYDPDGVDGDIEPTIKPLDTMPDADEFGEIDGLDPESYRKLDAQDRYRYRCQRRAKFQRGEVPSDGPPNGKGFDQTPAQIDKDIEDIAAQHPAEVMDPKEFTATGSLPVQQYARLSPMDRLRFVQTWKYRRLRGLTTG